MEYKLKNEDKGRKKRNVRGGKEEKETKKREEKKESKEKEEEKEEKIEKRKEEGKATEKKEEKKQGGKTIEQSAHINLNQLLSSEIEIKRIKEPVKAEFKHLSPRIKTEEITLDEAFDKLKSLSHYEFTQIPIKEVLNVLKLKHGLKNIEKPTLEEIENIKKRNKYLYDSFEAEIIEKEKNQKSYVKITFPKPTQKLQTPPLIEKQPVIAQVETTISKVEENKLHEKIRQKTLLLIEKDKEIAQLVSLCKNKDESFQLALESQSQYYSKNSSLSADEYKNLIKDFSISKDKLLDTMNLCGKQQEIIRSFIERIKSRVNLLENNLSSLEIKFDKGLRIKKIYNDLNEKLSIISLGIKEKKNEVEALTIKFDI